MRYSDPLPVTRDRSPRRSARDPTSFSRKKRQVTYQPEGETVTTITQVKARLTSAQTALTRATADRDQLIASLVADADGMTLYDIAATFGLSVPRIHTIAKRRGVTRGRSHYPATCSVQGCTRTQHSRGLCALHYDRQYRQS